MRSSLARWAAFVFVVLAVGVSPAAAQSPWWHLNSGERPAAIHEGVAKDEVQQLTVSATGGGYAVGRTATEPEAAVSFNATHEELQATLEGIYGAGNVVVSGGPGDEEGTKPYEIKFIGASTDQPVPIAAEQLPELSSAFALNCTGATGSHCREELTLTETAKGQPDGQLVLTVSNLGDATVNGASSAVRVTDVLPAGLRPLYIRGDAGAGPGIDGQRGALACPTAAEVGEGKPLTCSFEGQLPAYEHLEVVVGVAVEDEALAASGHNHLSVSGGEGYTCDVVGPGNGGFSSRACLLEETGKGVEAGGGFERSSTGPIANAAVSSSLTFGAARFGVEAYELSNELEGGEADTQAGSHPFQQTTTIFFNQTAAARPVALPKDVHLKWPAGLVGNPTPLPKCSLAQFLTILDVGRFENACPADTQVGVAVSTVNEVGANQRLDAFQAPLFNVEPSKGEPARFGFYVPGAPVFIDPTVRDGEDYGITVNADDITQTEAVLSSQVTVWGVPGEPVHDPERGFGCLFATRGVFTGQQGMQTCKPQEQAHPPSFLALPTACPANPTTHQPEPLKSIIEGDSWAEPQSRLLAEFTMPALDGCNQLPFEPSISVTPDGTAASSPSGLTVDVHVPQEESLNANGLTVADPRTITVALPEGVAVDPASGDGLGACSEPQVGFKGFMELPTEPGVNGPIFTPGVLEPFCPDSAKIGTAKITTPLLPHPLEGSVYLATQNENPFKSLIAMYIVAEDEQSGVQIKLAGQVHLSGTGQLVTTFEDSPQAPFEDAELHFFGGERAPLATPAHCGSYTTTAQFTPWSQEPGEAPHTASSTFDITSGPHGSPCPGPLLPFAPSLTGGSTNINAGSFSPLTTTIGREDGEQDLQSVKLHMPAGLEGLLSSVKLCAEAQANAGSCGPESLIGETTVSAGVGSDPVSVKGGRVYITGPYSGAPFGLSIVNPVKAGPFDLEHDTSNPAQNPACDCVVVRARIEVDPRTAELTITTDTTGAYAIPHLIDGIPVQIKKVNVLINRPNFTFNPTSCSPLSLTGSITGVEGASSPVSVPFQATNCAVLKFQPKFHVSTSGKTSKNLGASLTATVSEPAGAFGKQANISLVKVELPKQLPSRLTTLQKACTSAQFELNPANCPTASKIGHAKVITPLLPVPLEGPAIFVSHGGEAFPSLTMVLQGAPPYGVTVDLVGTTFISKAGITSTTFKTVPDVPFNTFSLTLPEGKFSALAANGNLCGQTLKMPNEFKGQNGLVIHQTTKITVTGCAKKTQRLTAALKFCRKDKNKGKRQKCEQAARQKFGPLKQNSKGRK